jgi:preprotein translocase subunit SecD
LTPKNCTINCTIKLAAYVPAIKFITKNFMLLQAAKYIGAGLATIGLAGAGVGIGTGARYEILFFCL